jgi:hypothetical protein
MTMVRITVCDSSVVVSGKDFRPAEYVGTICVDEGNPEVETILRGGEVEIEANEAARILRKFGGSIISPDPPQL